MGKSKGIKTIIIIIVLALLVGGYYFYLSNKEQETEEVEVTEVQEAILRDLDTNYPPTPKEVVKFYSELSQCLYNEDYTDEQFKQLVSQMRLLCDEELLENNPIDQYMLDLQDDIDDFHDAGWEFTSYTLSSSVDVEESVVNGREYAKLYSTETFSKSSKYSSTRKVYELRKDQDSGHWKILGFSVVTSDDEQE